MAIKPIAVSVIVLLFPFLVTAVTWSAITVDGDQVRYDFEQSLDQGQDILSQGVPLIAESRDDLEVVAKFFLLADANIKKISITADTIDISYNQSAALFGFLSLPFVVHIKSTISDKPQMNATGAWWLFLARDDMKNIREKVSQTQSEFVAPPESDGSDIPLRHKLLVSLIKSLGPLGQN